MLSALIGLSSAVIFGAADFFGGLASQRVNPLHVTAIVSAVGLCVLAFAHLLVFPLLGGEWSGEAVMLGAVAGITGACASTLLYACLAEGPMSILSPLTALVSAMVPLSIGLAQSATLTATGYVAIVLALIAVVLVGFIRENGAVLPRFRGVLMAVGAGVMIGAFLVFMDRSPAEAGLVPLIVSRAVNGGVMVSTIGLLALLKYRHRHHGILLVVIPEPPDLQNHAQLGGIALTRTTRAGIKLAALCGVVDATAAVGLLMGLRHGELSVISVLSALYPAGTIALAAVVLKERIAPVQYAGLAVALVSAVLFANA